MKNNKNIDVMQIHMNKNNLLQIYVLCYREIIYFKYMNFILYVTVLIRHIVNLLFIQRITMFKHIITMFKQYFKE